MCIRVDCPICHKPTWKGCGEHVEAVLGDVPEADRCQGHVAQQSSTVARPEANGVSDTQYIPSAPRIIEPSASDTSRIITTAIKTLDGHSERVWHISWQKEQGLLATASADKTVRVYSTKEYRYLGTIDGNHTRSIRSCAWRPGDDKPVLATASFDSTAGIWDCQNDESKGETEWECAGLLEGHENEVKDVAWSASGTILATCSRDKSIWIWECDNYEDPECLSVMQEHSQDVKCLRWHPHEELLASGSYDDDIRLWRDDGDDWICCARLQGHEATVWALDFENNASGTSPRIASASADSTIRIWIRDLDPASMRDRSAIPSIIRPNLDQVWRCETILKGFHTGNIYSICWSESTARIASTGEDGSICIFVQSLPGVWSLQYFIPRSHGVHEVNHLAWGAYSAESENIYSAGDDGTVQVWAIPCT